MREDPLRWIKDTTTPADQPGIPGKAAMTDTPQITNLIAILTRLGEEWEELSEILRHQAQSQRRVIEAERFVLLDAAGKPRGQLAVKEDGASELSLCDKNGMDRVWLGVKEDGSAFLSLKDHYGRIFFELWANKQVQQAARPPEATDLQQPVGPESVTYRELPSKKEEQTKPGAAAALVTGKQDKLLLTGKKEITEALGLSWQEVQRLKKEYHLPVIERHGGLPLLCSHLLREWALDMWGAEIEEK